jgi:hypothetical protein
MSWFRKTLVLGAFSLAGFFLPALIVYFAWPIALVGKPLFTFLEGTGRTGGQGGLVVAWAALAISVWAIGSAVVFAKRRENPIPGTLRFASLLSLGAVGTFAYLPILVAAGALYDVRPDLPESAIGALTVAMFVLGLLGLVGLVLVRRNAQRTEGQ